MEAPKMPVKVITKILVEEITTWLNHVRKESTSLQFSDEFREIFSKHTQMIFALDSYEKINDYLMDYRRLSLEEWANSL